MSLSLVDFSLDSLYFTYFLNMTANVLVCCCIAAQRHVYFSGLFEESCDPYGPELLLVTHL